MVASTCPHRPLNRRVALHGEHVLREIWIGAQSGHSDGYRERLLMAGITLRQKWGDAVLGFELQERSATKLAKEHPAWKSPRGSGNAFHDAIRLTRRPTLRKQNRSHAKISRHKKRRASWRPDDRIIVGFFFDARSWPVARDPI
jgi:hypothetical protein